MTCLCYCVLHRPQPQVPPVLAGVEGRHVYLVNGRSLSAAVSRLAPREAAPDLARIRVYEQVIHAFHRNLTVIPLRYGCLLVDDSQVSRLLEERGPLFEGLLQELEGCVEMGLRVLLPGGPVPPGAAEDNRPAPAAPPLYPGECCPERPGLAYLRARRAYYCRQETWSQGHWQACEALQDAFAGLFVRCRFEGPGPRLPLLSLFFLVPRAKVEGFRQAFRLLRPPDSARMLLSGPWPPYNFVSERPPWEGHGGGDGPFGPARDQGALTPGFEADLQVQDEFSPGEENGGAR